MKGTIRCACGGRAGYRGHVTLHNPALANRLGGKSVVSAAMGNRGCVVLWIECYYIPTDL